MTEISVSWPRSVRRGDAIVGMAMAATASRSRVDIVRSGPRRISERRGANRGDEGESQDQQSVARIEPMSADRTTSTRPARSAKTR